MKAFLAPQGVVHWFLQELGSRADTVKRRTYRGSLTELAEHSEFHPHLLLCLHTHSACNECLGACIILFSDEPSTSGLGPERERGREGERERGRGYVLQERGEREVRERERDDLGNWRGVKHLLGGGGGGGDPPPSPPTAECARLKPGIKFSRKVFSKTHTQAATGVAGESPADVSAVRGVRCSQCRSGHDGVAFNDRLLIGAFPPPSRSHYVTNE